MGNLSEVAIFLAAAVITVPLFRRLKLGAVLGYLAAGLIIGPWGLRLVTDVDNILHLGELGVVLLLFVIGLELQPSRLWILRKAVFGLGTAQVVITGAALALLGWTFGLTWKAALVAGLGLAMSSTALVLQVLAERGELTARHGRSAFAILLFQDLSVIPMLALIPLLADGGDNVAGGSAWLEAAKAIAVIVAVVAAGRYLLRPVLRQVADTGVREIFTAAALLVVIGVSLLMTAVGLSMSLGAFLAGVVLADSEYRHELEADIEPFKGLLLGLFFIAVGMSANVGLAIDKPLLVLAAVIALVAVKGTVLFLIAKWAGQTTHSALSLAAALAAGGEFAFVLFGVGQTYRIMDRELVDLLVVVVTLSMAATPLALALSDRLARRHARAQAERPFDTIDADESKVIIAGFGRVGQIVGRILVSRRIPFTALDIDPQQVETVRRFGNKVYYGDASRLDLLQAARADRAEIFVLAIDDVEKSLLAAEMVHKHFPDLRIFARARNRFHAYRLMDIGCELITRETFSSSLAMAEQVLKGLGLPAWEAEQTVATFKAHDERTLERQHAIYHDETQLIQTVKEARVELDGLFDSDHDDHSLTLPGERPAFSPSDVR